MAILVMHAKIRFSPNVKPICLPTQDIQDEDREAFTAGYGLRYVSEKKEDAVLANELQSSCLTNEIGPSTFNHCQGIVAEILYLLLQQILLLTFLTRASHRVLRITIFLQQFVKFFQMHPHKCLQ